MSKNCPTLIAIKFVPKSIILMYIVLKNQSWILPAFWLITLNHVTVWVCRLFSARVILFYFHCRAEYIANPAVHQLTNPSDQLQLRTFTRWCNKHLETVGDHIDNLFLDLRDGLKLVALVQVISKKKISGNVRKSKNRIHWLNNVSMVLQFLDEENLKLVNIGKSILFSLSS